MTISKERVPEFHSDHKNTSSPVDTFLKMFPYYQFLQISYHTTGRLTIFENNLHLPCKTSDIFNFIGIAWEVQIVGPYGQSL